MAAGAAGVNNSAPPPDSVGAGARVRRGLQAAQGRLKGVVREGVVSSQWPAASRSTRGGRDGGACTYGSPLCVALWCVCMWGYEAN